ncbi:MAG: sulfite exporter TauE/SafE family protein [Actinomycetota bacterium]|nr:sulfite exporter TauE/SafE family protein [Actinomycetota bacterium]
MRGLAASPIGFLIGLSLGALGGGGSILAVPALVYVAGQRAQAATTTSLIVVGLASLLGMGDHWRAGRVRVGPGLVFGLSGAGGSLAGSALNRRLDPDVLLLVFAGLVLVAAWRMLTGCPTCTKEGERQAKDAEGSGGATVVAGLRIDAPTVVKFLTAGTAVGFFTGLFGVGGGFVIIPALTLMLGFAMPEAIGTSLLIIAINSAVALAARLGDGGIDWAVTAPFTLAALAGVLAGGRVADRLPARTMLRWFAGLLVAVALYTATRSILSLT